MSTFRFRLETLLKLRRAALDEQRAKLAEAYHAETVLRERQREVDQQLEDARQERRAASTTGEVNVDAAVQAQRYEWVLQAHRQGLVDQARQLAEAIEQQRRRVVEADREVKVLEKLRERRFAEHVQSEERREVKQMDEAAARMRREGA